MTIQAIPYSGRLHIAVEQYHQGSINSYSRFFAWLFKFLGLARDIQVNQKTFCVNKKSYDKFYTCNRRGNETLEMFVYRTVKTETYIADQIHSQKRNTKFRKEFLNSLLFLEHPLDKMEKYLKKGGSFGRLWRFIPKECYKQVVGGQEIGFPILDRWFWPHLNNDHIPSRRDPIFVVKYSVIDMLPAPLLNLLKKYLYLGWTPSVPAERRVMPLHAIAIGTYYII